MSVFDQAASLVRRIGGLYGRGLQASERLALQALRARMDAVAPEMAAAEERRDAQGESPPALMAALLERSLGQDTEASRRDVHLSILRQLVPDEARILAALAEGARAPLVHVLPRAGGDRILENASLIGRTAALTLPSMTPAYVTHLRALGLVETGPEDPEDKQGYEMLMADRAVRAAMKEGELSKLPARVVRRTVVLSARGRELWEACRP